MINAEHSNPSPQCLVGDPSSFSAAELREFVDLLASGGKVAAGGLLARVKKAGNLAFIRDENGEAVAVAGLKRPEPSYRSKVVEIRRGTAGGWLSI